MKQNYSNNLWRLLLIGLFWNSYAVAFSQVERQIANHWFFGNQFGMNFSSGAPEVDNTSAMFTYESSTTVSDKEGNLLFYTNGGGRVDSTVLGFIWNRNHEVMEGGELGAFMGGGYSAAQGAISIERPGMAGHYFLFTIDELETLNTEGNPFPEGKGLSYFEIDINANAGLGEVIVANEKLLTPAFEHLSITKHGNCEDYWLLARSGHGFIANDPTVADSFYLFKISDLGIEAPIISPIPAGVECTDWEAGMLRFSPSGNHFICGGYLFDFDKNTGSIGAVNDLTTNLGVNPEFPLAFSSDGELVYYFSVANIGDIALPIVKFFCAQYEIATGDIYILTEITYTGPEAPISNLLGTPQLAPDGKMYIPFYHGTAEEPGRIYVVENPNIRGVDAQFHGPILTLSPPENDLFLRFGNYADHIFYVNNTETIDLDLPDEFILNCEEVTPFTVSSPASFDCMLWSTGDTSTTIEIEEEGIYYLEVVENCEIGRDTFELIYENNLFDLDLGNDTIICEGESLALTLEIPGAAFIWQDSSITPFIFIEEPGLYWVEANVGACIDQDTLNVDVILLPTVDIGGDTTVCEEAGLILDASGPNNWSFEWQDGSTDTTFTVDGLGFYSVTVENECGNAFDEIFVNLTDCEDCDIQFPNAFMPAGNTTSNTFGGVTDCVFTYFNLRVFNRWGGLVFEGYSISETWDGSQDGELSPTDVYFYLVEFEKVDFFGVTSYGASHGDVTLIR